MGIQHWMEQFHEESGGMAIFCGRIIKILWNDKTLRHLYPDYIALLCCLSREDKNSYSERREKDEAAHFYSKYSCHGLDSAVQ